MVMAGQGTGSCNQLDANLLGSLGIAAGGGRRDEVPVGISSPKITEAYCLSNIYRDCIIFG